MRKRTFLKTLLFLAAVPNLGLPALAAQSWLNRSVLEIQPPRPTRDCIYFRVGDVTVADPLVPGGPYFALRPDEVGFKEIYVLLLTAYTAGTTVSVKTSGVAAGGACGNYVGIEWVIAP